MASVLKDQGLPEPEIGVNYAFAEYWNGNAIEKMCNGGAHAVIIVGQFRSGPYSKDFQGYAFDLDTALDATFKKGVRANYRARVWEPFTSMHKQAKINALGRVRQDMSIEKLSELVIDKSTIYFERYPEYDLLVNNCGQYVNYIMGVIGTEFHAYGDLPGEKKRNKRRDGRAVESVAYL
ncbi:hypothetical protein BKA58DRAFT_444883 [Alternaria rosae]|nr:uncharacterized protein BKA58DRAFT_444883 [Alternaria rosae]KAH6851381.1 hypothetical protein BKA58DRAFT_444883 [Alternaria rosae]